MSHTRIERSTDDTELDRHVYAITTLEGIVVGWDAEQATTVEALKSAIVALHKEVLVRLIRTLKNHPAAGPRLRAAVGDPIVCGVLTFHGLLRELFATRLARTLDKVRPFMREHGGDVELVRIDPPDAIDVRLTGACHGCPASSDTFREGVERAFRLHCPEIAHIRQVSKRAIASDAAQVISPFLADTDAG